MTKRRIKLNEDDLKSFLTMSLRSSGFMTEESEIIGFEYKVKRIKKGGDYYKDGIDDPDYPNDGVEEVVMVKVLTETKARKNKDEDASTDDETSEGQED
jgi:hypothetical protein